METRQCGKSDLRLSVLGMGCWAFGGGKYWGAQSQSDVNATVQAAVDFGINYFDSAEAYNNGGSESSLGEALKLVPRDKVIVGTKISPSNVAPDELPKHWDESRKRLGVDYVDLYMVHWPITLRSIYHFNTEMKVCPPVEEAFATLMKMRDEGKIRYIGVSNFGPAKMDEALATGADIAINELPRNLLCRAIEYEILPYCKRKGIGILGYMALLQGILADIFPTLDDVPPMQRRTRHFDSRKCREVRHGENGHEAEINAALQAIRAIGKDLGLTMPQVAVKWAISNPAVTSTLVGARNARELEDNAKAVTEPLPAEVIERLNQATDEVKEKMGPSFDYYETRANDRTI